MTATLHIVVPSYPDYKKNIRAGYEFFTDELNSSYFTNIVDSINTCTSHVFRAAEDTLHVELGKVIYILCKKNEFLNLNSPSVLLEFTFSNAPPVTIKHFITNQADIKEYAKKTMEKCKIMSKVLTFSCDNETIIINRHFLTSVHVIK